MASTTWTATVPSVLPCSPAGSLLGHDQGQQYVGGIASAVVGVRPATAQPVAGALLLDERTPAPMPVFTTTAADSRLRTPM